MHHILLAALLMTQPDKDETTIEVQADEIVLVYRDTEHWSDATLCVICNNRLVGSKSIGDRDGIDMPILFSGRNGGMVEIEMNHCSVQGNYRNYRFLAPVFSTVVVPYADLQSLWVPFGQGLPDE